MQAGLLLINLIDEIGDHPNMHGRKIPCLMDWDKYGIIPGGDLNIRRFRGFYTDRKEDRTTTWRRNAKIALPLHDEGYHLIGDPDISDRKIAAVSGVHAMLTSWAGNHEKSDPVPSLILAVQLTILATIPAYCSLRE
jgi:hypothetical protein